LYNNTSNFKATKFSTNIFQAEVELHGALVFRVFGCKPYLIGQVLTYHVVCRQVLVVGEFPEMRVSKSSWVVERIAESFSILGVTSFRSVAAQFVFVLVITA
jgi:hypothetical protein